MHGGSPSLLGHTSCHQDWTARLRNWHEKSTSHKFHSCQVWVACWKLREQRLCLRNKIAEYDACHNMKSGASRQMVVSSKRLWRASKDNAMNSWQPKSKVLCLRLIVVSNEVSAVLQEKYRTWNKTYTQLYTINMDCASTASTLWSEPLAPGKTAPHPAEPPVGTLWTALQTVSIVYRFTGNVRLSKFLPVSQLQT